jgi:hypothetical protein
VFDRGAQPRHERVEQSLGALALTEERERRRVRRFQGRVLHDVLQVLLAHDRHRPLADLQGAPRLAELEVAQHRQRLRERPTDHYSASGRMHARRLGLREWAR